MNNKDDMLAYRIGKGYTTALALQMLGAAIIYIGLKIGGVL